MVYIFLITRFCDLESLVTLFLCVWFGVTIGKLYTKQTNKPLFFKVFLIGTVFLSFLFSLLAGCYIHTRIYACIYLHTNFQARHRYRDQAIKIAYVNQQTVKLDRLINEKSNPKVNQEKKTKPKQERTKGGGGGGWEGCLKTEKDGMIKNIISNPSPLKPTFPFSNFPSTTNPNNS